MHIIILEEHSSVQLMIFRFDQFCAAKGHDGQYSFDSQAYCFMIQIRGIFLQTLWVFFNSQQKKKKKCEPNCTMLIQLETCKGLEFPLVDRLHGCVHVHLNYEYDHFDTFECRKPKYLNVFLLFCAIESSQGKICLHISANI